MVGFGTWEMTGDQAKNSVKEALVAGYRHIDTAAYYENEEEVGQGIKESGVSRIDIFLTSKLWCTDHRPEHVALALDESLRKLGTDYLDLYLIHWPIAFVHGKGLLPRDENGELMLDEGVTLEQTWNAMEKLLQNKQVRAIGVSNFNADHMKQLCRAHVQPAVNQIEMHPYLHQSNLLDYCRYKEIHVTAYSPLGSSEGRNQLLEEPVISEISERTGQTPAQIVLAWNLHRGCSVLPKSRDPKHIKQNLNLKALSGDDFEKISEIKTRHRYSTSEELFNISGIFTEQDSM